jgi:hypothetical protein
MSELQKLVDKKTPYQFYQLDAVTGRDLKSRLLLFLPSTSLPFLLQPMLSTAERNVAPEDFMYLLIFSLITALFAQATQIPTPVQQEPSPLALTADEEWLSIVEELPPLPPLTATDHHPRIALLKSLGWHVGVTSFLTAASIILIAGGTYPLGVRLHARNALPELINSPLTPGDIAGLAQREGPIDPSTDLAKQYKGIGIINQAKKSLIGPSITTLLGAVGLVTSLASWLIVIKRYKTARGARLHQQESAALLQRFLAVKNQSIQA